MWVVGKEVSKSRWKRVWDHLTSWRGFEVCAATLTVGLAIWAVHLSWQANREARIVSAWDILVQPAPGNSGKTEAIETLLKSRQVLRGIDLSCEMHAVRGSFPTRPEPAVDDPNAAVSNEFTCPEGKAVWLQGLEVPDADLRDADFSDADLRDADFSDADLWEADLTGADLQNGDFGKASLLSADLSGANLTIANLSDAVLSIANLSGANLTAANLSDARVIAADLTDADLRDADFGGTLLSYTNLSEARFCSLSFGSDQCARNLTQDQIDLAWAWSDLEPIFESGDKKLDLRPPRLCDPSLRPDYEANNKRGVPPGCSPVF